MVSRAVHWHGHFKRSLEELQYPNVTVTAMDKDGLDMLISDLKPDLLLMGAQFYDCATPYMFGLLKKRFKKLDMVALSLGNYPADLAMYFIVNGARAYHSAWEGPEQWYDGLKKIQAGKKIISPNVRERMEKRSEYPTPVKEIKGRLLEITRGVCCGYKEREIANMLGISESTVNKEKQIIFKAMNVRGSTELLRNALSLRLVTQEELDFFPAGFALSPKPERHRTERRGQLAIRRQYDYQNEGRGISGG